ncbi:MAG: pyruvate formate lyase family protein [Myxococcota bacterium]|nr:pyruvate formate lyase family protein [Myxococcota bacterium]
MSSEPATVIPWKPSARIQRLYEDHSRATPSIGAERALHYTEFYKRLASPDASPLLLNAQSLAHHLDHRSIRIHDDELIVGSHTEHRVGAICHVEKAGSAMLEDVFHFETREVNPLAVAKGVKWKLLREVAPYWLGRSLPMRAFSLRKKVEYAAEQLTAAHFVINEVAGVAHFLPDYGGLVELGTNGLREKVEARLAAGELPEDGRDFLAACLLCIDAVERFSDRYRDEARRIGRDDIAEVLEWVPRNPPRSLREALQLIWFFQLIIQIESIDQGISLGRMDQYLYPIYLEQKRRGEVDDDEARELFAAFCIKLSEVIPMFSARATEYFAGLPSGQALTIGGIDEAGRCASNELTGLLLDVMEGFKTRQPNWHARISKASVPDYLRRVVSVVAGGGGSPALYNDDVIMPAMVERHVAKEKVWNYATVGCVEPALSRESFTSSDAAIFNLAIALEWLFAGEKRMAQGKTCRRPWLSDLTSMDQLIDRLEAQTRGRLLHMKGSLDAIEQSGAKYFPTPLSSLTIGGCIENATDSTRGGAWYNASGIQAVGIADLANSLAVVDELVFERELCSLEEIANACAANFEGEDLLLARARKIAAFGNDDARVDALANRVALLFDRCVSSLTNTRGGEYMPGFYSMTCHQGFGRKMAAMPSGRLAGAPLADGLAPVDGSDLLGPTASLNSVARLDHTRFANGINLNIKFDAATVEGAEGRAALEALVRGYFAQGGMQVQINVLDPDVLEEAMRDPDSHRNLLVRISGYCAYFVDLTPAMQRELIDRTRQRAR